MNRVGLVFVLCTAVAVALSLMEKPSQAALRVDLRNIDYSTSGGFNAAALIVVGILVALYAVWW
jgi:SSS family solute:Na+ symporter